MITRSAALRFIVALGFISMFADVTYEGARSITGPYLGQLGANAALIGFVAGFGELIGYALRLASGYTADRTRAYWPLTIFGYILNLGAVPLLALTHRWEYAAALIVLERAGKAIRNPARDVMLSGAAQATGVGWGFSLHEAMDQTGSFIGPMLVALVVLKTGAYSNAFALLAIPAGLAISTLFTARHFYPHPVPRESAPAAVGDKFSRAFWVYVAAGALVAFGVVDFPLIAYHFQNTKLVAPALIPVFYAAATGANALTVILFGRAFDRFGAPVLLLSIVFTAAATPLVFLGSTYTALGGMMCWGAGLGSHQALLRASIAMIVPASRRGTAYGIFNTAYGLFWFAGSAAAGLLYARNVVALVALAVAANVAAFGLLLVARRTS